MFSNVGENFTSSSRFYRITQSTRISHSLTHLYRKNTARKINTRTPTGTIRTRRSSDVMFYSFTSFLYPGTIYSLRKTKQGFKQDVIFDMKVQGFDRSKFFTKQFFYKSKDGTKIPMFMVGPKDDDVVSSRPTLLYGYGGFNISLTPYFSVTRLCWMKVFNANFVMANIRGGGEYVYFPYVSVMSSLK